MKEIRRRNRTSTLAIKQPPLPTSWVYLISFILRIGSGVEPWQYSRALHASRYRCDHQSVANIAIIIGISKQKKIFLRYHRQSCKQGLQRPRDSLAHRRGNPQPQRGEKLADNEPAHGRRGFSRRYARDIEYLKRPRYINI